MGEVERRFGVGDKAMEGGAYHSALNPYPAASLQQWDSPPLPPPRTYPDLKTRLMSRGTATIPAAAADSLGYCSTRCAAAPAVATSASTPLPIATRTSGGRESSSCCALSPAACAGGRAGVRGVDPAN